MPHDRPPVGRRLTALLGGLAFAVIAGAALWRAPVAPTPPAPAVSQAPSQAALALRAHSPAVRPSASPTDVPTTEHDGPDRTGIQPVDVRIPAIDVAAAVVDLGLREDGTLEVPEVFDEAGWWTGGAAPGADGPAVVAGHVDSRAGPAVFHRLRELRPGDRVELRDRDGRVVRFAVDRLERHAKDDFPTAAVYGDTEHPTLRLITCGGTFDRSVRSYVDNVIVYASLVG